MTRPAHTAPTYDELVAALTQAADALDIATDWQFVDVELNGKWHRVADLVDKYEAILARAKEPQA